MSRPALEVADIFRDHGAAWRKANAGHVSLGQMKVMSAIEHCRTAALGGHVARCENDKCARTTLILPWMGAIAAFSVSDGAAVRRLGLAQVCPIQLLESRPTPQRFQSFLKPARTATCASEAC